MDKKKAKPINRKMWGYFAPDGYLQVRSIADTKKLSREMLTDSESVTYKHYEAKGYFLKLIYVRIEIL